MQYFALKFEILTFCLFMKDKYLKCFSVDEKNLTLWLLML